MNSFYAIIAVLALFMIGGFYFAFNQIADLRSDVKNLELTMEMTTEEKSDKGKTTNDKGQETSDKGQMTNDTEQKINDEQQENDSDGVAIPTAIIFEAQSSPLLQPQTKMMVTVESVVKKDDGTTVLNLKVFSSEATSYSAFEARDFFEMIKLDGDNQKPLKAEGQFASIPPKSAVYGTIIFKIKIAEQKIILQMGAGENLKFYEFDFEKENYKETVIG